MGRSSKEKTAKYNHDYYVKNREKILAKNKKWAKEHRERANELSRISRAKKRYNYKTTEEHKESGECVS